MKMIEAALRAELIIIIPWRKIFEELLVLNRGIEAPPEHLRDAAGKPVSSLMAKGLLDAQSRRKLEFIKVEHEFLRGGDVAIRREAALCFAFEMVVEDAAAAGADDDFLFLIHRHLVFLQDYPDMRT